LGFAAALMVVARRVSWSLVPPPFRRAVAANPVEITPQRSALRLKTIGMIPFPREGFLHKVLGHLRTADQLP
jgi:hypothetical protein